LKAFYSTLNTITILATVFLAACSGNTLPPATAEPTASSTTVTAPPATRVSITPLVTPAVQATPAHVTATPTPAPVIVSAPPCTEIGQTWTSPVDGAILVCVPAGEFLMGAATDDYQAQGHEKPQHPVYLDAFWIDRTEVTNANFAKCMAAGACQPKIYELSAETYTPYAIHPDYQDFPALLYEAEVAAAYCQWTGRRLPTEAEWEKAARGTDGRAYPWGNELDCSKANYYACDTTSEAGDLAAPGCGYSAHCHTSRVDDYPAGASPYGVLNMAGNVWEWVADWYSPEYYANSPGSNPTGPDEGAFRVRRGGGNRSLSQDLRVTARASGSPHHYFDGQMGFRCAMSAPVLPEPSIAQEPGQVTEGEDAFGIFYTYVPTTVPEKPDILVLVHGTPSKDEMAESNAQYYINNWVDFAENQGLILIAPAFNQENFSSRLGDHAMSGYRGLFGREIGADAWILRLVRAYQQAFEMENDSFYLYGHSAGGQFTGRFLVTHPESVKRAVITSAATYPQPDTEVAWPFGMGELHTDIVWDADTIKHVDVVPDKEKWLAATQIPLTVIVGLNDTAELPLSLIPGQKGKNRYTIARNWIQDMAVFAQANGLESRFEFEIIPGQGHSMCGLMPYSQEALEIIRH